MLSMYCQFRSDSQLGPGPGPSTARQPSVQQKPRSRLHRQVVPEQACREVAEKIFKKDWMRVANKLGFFTQDVEEIRSAYPNNVQHQVSQCSHSEGVPFKPYLFVCVCYIK